MTFYLIYDNILSLPLLLLICRKYFMFFSSSSSTDLQTLDGVTLGVCALSLVTITLFKVMYKKVIFFRLANIRGVPWASHDLREVTLSYVRKLSYVLFH